MNRRLVFHLFHFAILNVLIYIAAYIYLALEYGGGLRLYLFKNAYLFVERRLPNFILISIAVYVFSFLIGLVKYTVEERGLRFVDYLKEMFKFLLVLAFVSFFEFVIFYQARVGRLIYFYILLLYGLYYFIYFKVRTRPGAPGLLWLAAESPSRIFNVSSGYIKKEKAYTIYSEKNPPPPGEWVEVVYQDGHLDEQASEALIKNKLAGFPVVELAQLVERESARIPLDYVNIQWFLQKFDVIDRDYFRASRLFNVVLAVLLLVVLFPLGFLIALLHKCFSRGPLFFVQERMGLHEKPFKLIKFRTMVADAEKSGARFADKDDPRITRIGKFMRRFRVDEIPQLLNVIKGDMSLVGPRPEREVFIGELSGQVPYYRLRLLVPPGLTGWAQINGVYAGHNIKEHKEKLEFDLYYIKNRSIFMDLLILLQTIRTIFLGKGE